MRENLKLLVRQSPSFFFVETQKERGFLFGSAHLMSWAYEYCITQPYSVNDKRRGDKETHFKKVNKIFMCITLIWLSDLLVHGFPEMEREKPNIAPSSPPSLYPWSEFERESERYRLSPVDAGSQLSYWKRLLKGLNGRAKLNTAAAGNRLRTPLSFSVLPQSPLHTSLRERFKYEYEYFKDEKLPAAELPSQIFFIDLDSYTLISQNSTTTNRWLDYHLLPCYYGNWKWME